MEILIVGLIIVALMVYASTRIKRTAAEAFDPERIETDDFVIEKPEGFLNVLNRDPSLEFDAYSRDFGPGHASSFRAARCELRVINGRSLNESANALLNGSTVHTDLSEIIDGRKYRVVETEAVEKGVGFREIYKLAESGDRVFEMKLRMVEDADAEIMKSAELMLASFEVK